MGGSQTKEVRKAEGELFEIFRHELITVKRSRPLFLHLCLQQEDQGIITVARQRSSERIHPFLQQLKNLKQVCERQGEISTAPYTSQDISFKGNLLLQVPPLLNEGNDPAWKGLQQDLQLMNVKQTSALSLRCQECLLESLWISSHSDKS